MDVPKTETIEGSPQAGIANNDTKECLDDFEMEMGSFDPQRKPQKQQQQRKRTHLSSSLTSNQSNQSRRLSGRSILSFRPVALAGYSRRSSSFLNLSAMNSRSPGLSWISVVLVVLLCGCYLLPAWFVELDVTLPLTSDKKFLIMANGLSVLPMALFLRWAKWRLTKSFRRKALKQVGDEYNRTFQWKDFFKADQTASLLLLAILMFRQLRAITDAVVLEDLKETAISFLNIAGSLALFGSWLSFLDDVQSSVKAYADDLDSVSIESSKTIRWRSIMQDFSKFNDPAVDMGYELPGGSRSPARVLAEITGVYCNIARLTGLFMLLLFFLDVNLESNLVAVGITLLVAGLIQALRLNDALGNVLPLSLSNTFHVGEIISVSRTGFKPGTDPESALTGFVEGVTWSHVVVRDFRRQQTFIPHDEFDKMTIANWSRRPSKLCHFRLAATPGLSRGAAPLAALARFASRWIDKHPQIDQDKYKKSCIKLSSESGQYLEVIFYPKVGQRARVVRSEFLVMVMDAAQRLNICVTPAEVRTGSCWAEANIVSDLEDDMDESCADLMPSEKLTYRAGFDRKANSKKVS